jgi:hypothetical protein
MQPELLLTPPLSHMQKMLSSDSTPDNSSSSSSHTTQLDLLLTPLLSHMRTMRSSRSTQDSSSSSSHAALIVAHPIGVAHEEDAQQRQHTRQQQQQHTPQPFRFAWSNQCNLLPLLKKYNTTRIVAHPVAVAHEEDAQQRLDAWRGQPASGGIQQGRLGVQHRLDGLPAAAAAASSSSKHGMFMTAQSLE